MPLFTGVNGVNREVKKLYAGVNGSNRELKSLLVGVNGVNREVLKPPPLVIVKDGFYQVPFDGNLYWTNIYTSLQGSGSNSIGVYVSQYYDQYTYITGYNVVKTGSTHDLSKYNYVRISFINRYSNAPGYNFEAFLYAHTTPSNLFDGGSSGTTTLHVNRTNNVANTVHTVEVPLSNFKDVNGNYAKPNANSYLTLVLASPQSLAYMYIMQLEFY